MPASPWANPLTHIMSGFSAVSGGRFLLRSAGSSSLHSTSTQSPSRARVASLNAVTPFGWSAGAPAALAAGAPAPRRRGQALGVQKRGSGMSTTVSMPAGASFMSGM